MKLLVTIIVISCLLAGLYVGFFKRTSKPANRSSPAVAMSNGQVASDVILMKTNVDGSVVIPLEAASPTNPKVIYKPEDFSNATTDQATMEFYSKLRHWTDLGKVHATEKNTQQLWLGDRMVFEAKVIQQFRTMSSDGTIVLAAVTEDVAQPANEEKLRNSQLPSSIWVVDAQGHARRISPPNTIYTFTLPERSDTKRLQYPAASRGR